MKLKFRLVQLYTSRAQYIAINYSIYSPETKEYENVIAVDKEVYKKFTRKL